MEKFFSDLASGVIEAGLRGVITAEAANLVKAGALDPSKEAVTISGMTDGLIAFLKLYQLDSAAPPPAAT